MAGAVLPDLPHLHEANAPQAHHGADRLLPVPRLCADKQEPRPAGVISIRLNASPSIVRGSPILRAW